MHTIPRSLAPVASIGGLAYEAVVRLRNTLYDSGILSSRQLRSPVISIGNITTGGTGKTPLAAYIALKVHELGCVPAILTRGYGRSAPGKSSTIAPGEKTKHSAEETGDEPALIRRRVPQAWFGISKNRFHAGALIENTEDNAVFILDDGFQHRKLHRDLDIVVVDSSQPFETNSMLPKGTLREPLAGFRRCHAVVINGAEYAPAIADRIRVETLSPGRNIAFFQCEQFIEKLVPFGLWRNGTEAASQGASVGSAFLVAAIGNPARFHDDVRRRETRVLGARFFRDHYRLEEGDWTECIQEADKAGVEGILITEKDAVKIQEPPDFPLFVAVQSIRIRDEEEFMELLKNSLRSNVKNHPK